MKLKESEKRDWNKVFFALLIAFAVISFWRGVWGLMDIFLFPGNKILSLISSVIIGIVILILTRHTIKQLM
jgi:hypothetical protein